LGIELRGVAFRALGFLFAVDEGFEAVIAFLADVLEDGHERLQIQSLLESICEEFANQFANRGFAERSGNGRALA
jgi:hypothetical protein